MTKASVCLLVDKAAQSTAELLLLICESGSPPYWNYTYGFDLTHWSSWVYGILHRRTKFEFCSLVALHTNFEFLALTVLEIWRGPKILNKYIKFTSRGPCYTGEDAAYIHFVLYHSSTACSGCSLQRSYRQRKVKRKDVEQVTAFTTVKCRWAGSRPWLQLEPPVRQRWVRCVSRWGWLTINCDIVFWLKRLKTWIHRRKNHLSYYKNVVSFKGILETTHTSLSVLSVGLMGSLLSLSAGFWAWAQSACNWRQLPGDPGILPIRKLTSICKITTRTKRKLHWNKWNTINYTILKQKSLQCWTWVWDLYT